MTPLARRLNGFGLSLLTHASLAGAALWLWYRQPPTSEAEPIRWEISLYSPAPPAPAEVAPRPEPTPAPKPPKPKLQAKPKPRPKPKAKLIEPAPPKPVTRYLAAETAPEVPPPAPAPAPATLAANGPLAGLANAAQPDLKPDFDWLRRYLADRIRENRRYPGEARRRGWEGQVLIRAVIGGKGDLLEAEIVRSSGHAVLDDEALATLRRVMPVPVSDTHGWSQVAVTIPFDYRLKRRDR